MSLRTDLPVAPTVFEALGRSLTLAALALAGVIGLAIPLGVLAAVKRGRRRLLLRFVADRVAVMYLGRIVEIRGAAGLAEPPYHPYTEALLSSAPSLDAGLDVRRVRLAGVIPSRIGLIEGCPFESRCPRRIGDICRQAPPAEMRRGENHLIACHLDAATLESVLPIWQPGDGTGVPG